MRIPNKETLQWKVMNTDRKAQMLWDLSWETIKKLQIHFIYGGWQHRNTEAWNSSCLSIFSFHLFFISLLIFSSDSFTQFDTATFIRFQITDEISHTYRFSYSNILTKWINLEWVSKLNNYVIIHYLVTKDEIIWAPV
jgi:hypothetical protein